MGLGILDRQKRLGRVFGLSADGQVRLLVDQVGQPLPNERVVVNQQNLCLGHGTVQVTTVPPVTPRATANFPANMLARWFMIRKPIPLPGGSDSGKPTPSS